MITFFLLFWNLGQLALAGHQCFSWWWVIGAGVVEFLLSIQPDPWLDVGSRGDG